MKDPEVSEKIRKLEKRMAILEMALASQERITDRSLDAPGNIIDLLLRVTICTGADLVQNEMLRSAASEDEPDRFRHSIEKFGSLREKLMSREISLRDGREEFRRVLNETCGGAEKWSGYIVDWDPDAVS